MGKILIVEGAQVLRDVLSAALSVGGHEVVAEGDAAGALMRLREQSFDVVIAALELPGVSATELLAQVRQVAGAVPVLLVADASSVAQAVEVAKHGAYGHVQTPVSIDELGVLVTRALEYIQLVRENEILKGRSKGNANGDGAVVTPLAEIEKQVILNTLEQFKGHRMRTASALGIGVRTLGMKLKRWREEGQLIEVGR